MRFLLRRFASCVLLLGGISVLVFVLLQAAPGEFFSDLKLNPQISPATIAALRSQFGMDRSLPLRYVTWLGAVVRGDFGYSFAYQLPARTLLLGRARNTLLLTVTAMLLAWLISIPLGVYAALHAGSRWDRLLSGSTAVLLAVPELTLALGVLILASRTRLLPMGGMWAPRETGFALGDLARHMIGPVAVVALGNIPVLVRHVRSAMIEVLGAAFMRAARGHGLGRGRIVLYACLAAANPMISLAGLSIAALLSSSLLTEVIFSWPGLGPLLLEATLARDIYVLLGAILLSTLFLIAGNLFADVLLYCADPRIRREAA